ncbi:hypothetical protein AIOL_004083 [Candidatus Rhodobacter oscarellae]|uniref:Uncharacterized protein n=1 Tax=Candidatus Rhodobacter oscarellae TaxID=1675527 RepID=A0A0J9E8K8_9RHOB|nr:hypothetical protein [Candidatus Rhodobacter lobularis]KMW59102.1 hypothetical protein AIOL_004083 [Candidatus Rhodobacter lobularis]
MGWGSKAHIEALDIRALAAGFAWLDPAREIEWTNAQPDAINHP